MSSYVNEAYDATIAKLARALDAGHVAGRPGDGEFGRAVDWTRRVNDIATGLRAVAQTVSPGEARNLDLEAQARAMAAAAAELERD